MIEVIASMLGLHFQPTVEEKQPLTYPNFRQTVPKDLIHKNNDGDFFPTEWVGLKTESATVFVQIPEKAECIVFSSDSDCEGQNVARSKLVRLSSAHHGTASIPINEASEGLVTFTDMPDFTYTQKLELLFFHNQLVSLNLNQTQGSGVYG